jgi:hypothetical protein
MPVSKVSIYNVDIRKIESSECEIELILKNSDQQWVIPCPDPAVTEVKFIDCSGSRSILTMPSGILYRTFAHMNKLLVFCCID